MNGHTTRRGVHTALVIAVGMVVLAAAMAPWLGAHGWHRPASLLNLSFSWACHQMPERSLWVSGAPMALCARCFAICVGALAALLVVPLLRVRLSLRWLPLAVAPTVLDFMLGRAGVLGNLPAVRVTTGALAGFAITLYLAQWIVVRRQT